MNIIFERFNLLYPKNCIKLRCQVEITHRELDFLREHKMADDEIYCFHDNRIETAHVRSAKASGFITGFLTHILFADDPDEKKRQLQKQSNQKQRRIQHASAVSDQSVTMRTLVKGHEFVATPFEIDQLEDDLTEAIQALEAKIYHSISKQQKQVKVIRGRS